MNCLRFIQYVSIICTIAVAFALITYAISVRNTTFMRPNLQQEQQQQQQELHCYEENNLDIHQEFNINSTLVQILNDQTTQIPVSSSIGTTTMTTIINNNTIPLRLTLLNPSILVKTSSPSTIIHKSIDNDTKIINGDLLTRVVTGTLSDYHDLTVAEETAAWKTLMSHPNSLANLLPSRAMRVVQEVVRSFRKDTRVIIITKAGQVKGRYQKYRSGMKGGYYSFKGIRYGAPPIGENRFRAAKAEQEWLGVRDASREGHNCPHKNMILDTLKGNEDCLFLNVFTKTLPQNDYNPNLAVMVWFHGGGYSFGSGNSFMYGPDYLVAEDIVLVTLNYRLGPLGFLTLGPNAPGNQGLKDQILALKWVQDNIAAFGGNPKQVTIFGESAGASSVQMLMLSPLSNGLFHRAISESGSALNPWSVGANSPIRAIHLANHLGYDGSNNTDEILDFLRRIPAMKLVNASPQTLTDEDFRNNVGLPFVPVVEGYWNSNYSETNHIFHEDPFITESPNELYKKHNFHKTIPYMIGYNTHEAMLFIRRLRKNPELLFILENDFGRLLPHDLNITNERSRVTREMRQFYLGSKHVGLQSVDEMIALLTDLMFLQGIRRTARLHAKFGIAPVYMYRFSFDGALGLYKRMLGLQRPGVCHGDEMGYLFKFGFFNLKLDPNSTEVLVKNRMVKMWTNFAKYGDPTPSQIEDNLLNTKWQPIDPTDVMENLNYLDISDTLEMKTNPEFHRQQFWDYMYNHYNGNAL